MQIMFLYLQLPHLRARKAENSIVGSRPEQKTPNQKTLAEAV